MLRKFDAQVLWVLFVRIASAVCGLVTIYIVSTKLNEINQGVYYAIFAFIAGQQFFDVGLNQVTYQYCAKSRTEQKIFTIVGEQGLSESVKSFVGESIKLSLCHGLFYSLIFISYFLVLGDAESDRKVLLLGLALPMAISFPIYTYLSAIEGLGFVEEVFKIRFAAVSISSVTIWVSFLAEQGLNSIIYQQIITISIFIWCLIKLPFRIKLRGNGHVIISRILFKHRIEIFTTNLSNFAAFYLPPLVIAQSGNLVLAGQFGMSLQIFNSITGFASSWINSKTYVLTEMYSKGNIFALRRFYFGQVIKSWLAFFLLLCIVIIIFVGLSYTSYMARLLPLAGIVALGFAFIGFHYYNISGPLLQSKLGDPIYKISIFRLTILFLAVPLVNYYNPYFVMLSILIAASLLPSVVCAFTVNGVLSNEN